MSERSVESLLAYYRRQVSDGLALTYSIADQFPIEILNELRNALGHMSRAAALSGDSEEKQQQLLSAEKHLLRIRLDCAKLNLLIIDEELDADLKILTRNAELPNSLLAGSKDFQSERRKLIVQEAEGPTDSLVNSYLALFEKMEEFQAKLRTEYSTLVSGAYEKKYEEDLDESFGKGMTEGRKKSWRRDITIGIIASIIGGAVIGAVAMLF
ncbi:MAG: hypothetical protein ACYYKD_02615 [Rhodospirillales bacterium]